MKRRALPLKPFAVAICGLAFAEWSLFEIIRIPYRPPQDMTTFLGTEKYAVVALMLGLAVGGFGFVSWWAARFAWTKRDVAIVAFLVAVLVGAGLYVVTNPGWPVTPLKWVLG